MNWLDAQSKNQTGSAIINCLNCHAVVLISSLITWANVHTLRTMDSSTAGGFVGPIQKVGHANVPALLSMVVGYWGITVIIRRIRHICICYCFPNITKSKYSRSRRSHIRFWAKTSKIQDFRTCLHGDQRCTSP